MRWARCCLTLVSIVLALFFFFILSLSPPGTAVVVVDLGQVHNSGNVSVYGDGGDDDGGDFDNDDIVPGPGGGEADGEEREDGAVLQDTQLNGAKVGGGSLLVH